MRTRVTKSRYAPGKGMVEEVLEGELCEECQGAGWRGGDDPDVKNPHPCLACSGKGVTGDIVINPKGELKQ
jgi:DnaJ-class molecular chaperone